MSNANTASKLQEEYRTSTQEEKARDFMTILRHFSETDPNGQFAKLYVICLQLGTESQASCLDYMLTLCAEQGE